MVSVTVGAIGVALELEETDGEAMPYFVMEYFAALILRGYRKLQKKENTSLELFDNKEHRT